MLPFENLPCRLLRHSAEFNLIGREYLGVSSLVRNADAVAVMVDRSEIDDKEKCLMVNYSGTYVFYQYEELSDISLAYAMSVHKAQGSEYQIVYFIFNRNNLHMLNKNLIYTAISRAKKKLVIIGREDLLEQGISRSLKRRNTGLLELLTNEK